MHKVGMFALTGGVLVTLIGLLGGFGFMFAGHDELAKPFLAAIPLGFLLGFAGLVTTLLNASQSDDRRPPE